MKNNWIFVRQLYVDIALINFIFMNEEDKQLLI